MEYVIADIRISLPEELIPRRFAEALRPFAVAEPIGRARAAGPEVAPREDAGRARAAGPEVAPRKDAGRARAAGPEVAPRKDAGQARSAGPEVAPRECKGVMPELIPGAVTRIHPAPGWQELHRFEFPDAGADCLRPASGHPKPETVPHATSPSITTPPCSGSASGCSSIWRLCAAMP